MKSPRRILNAWRLAKEAHVPLFGRGVGAALKTLPGWSSLGVDDTELVAVVEAVRALELLNGEYQQTAHQVEIVATLPTKGTDVASTRDAVIDIVRHAATELTVLGFGLTDQQLREEMIAAAARKVAVTVIGERSRDDLRAFAQSWPAIVPEAALLQLVEPPPGVSALMHAKVIIADRRRALIGSANFSSGGLKSNMELGLQIEGPQAARVCTIIEGLQKDRWLEPLKLDS